MFKGLPSPCVAFPGGGFTPLFYFRYTNWAPGEPNGRLGEGTNSAFLKLGEPAGQWDDTWGEHQDEARPSLCRANAKRPYMFGGARCACYGVTQSLYNR